MTIKDIKKAIQFPNVAKDARIPASVAIGLPDLYERAIQHKNIIEAVKKLRELYPKLTIIAGAHLETLFISFWEVYVRAWGTAVRKLWMNYEIIHSLFGFPMSDCVRAIHMMYKLRKKHPNIRINTIFHEFI